MIKIEEIGSKPSFSNQLENKILYANHAQHISISYTSTFTLKYVIAGTKRYTVNHQNLEVPKNHYLILNNCKLHSEATSGTKGLSLFLSPKLISEITRFHFGNDVPLKFLEVIQSGKDKTIQNLLDRMVHLYTQDRIGLEQQKDDLFLAVAEQLVKGQIAINKHFKKLRIVRHDTKRALYRSTLEARTFLHDNFRGKISLDTVSQNVGVSKYYLHRLFKEINGKTLQEYLTDIRLQNAKKQLQYSKDPIAEIAMDSGFENSAYFSNVFKKHTGISPTQFRQTF